MNDTALEDILWRIKNKANKKCWSSRDLLRVRKKIKELGCLEFDDAEMLCYMLDEDLDSRLAWSIIRLIKEDRIAVFKNKDSGMYCIEWLPF